MTLIEVLEGNIARVQVDALITAINSMGSWNGGIDRTIKECEGDWFHSQARDVLRSLDDTQTVLARGRGHSTIAFTHVLFVIDNLRLPLSEVVFAALMGAEEKGLTSVSLPLMRTGVAAGLVERSPYDTLQELVLGVTGFVHRARSVQTIKIVAMEHYYATYLRHCLDLDV